MSANPQHRDYYSWVPGRETLEGLAATEAPLIFDLETDGLLDSVSRLHCLVIHNPVSGETLSAHHEALPAALERLAQAPLLVGHNIIRYDLPVLNKLYPGWRPRGKAFDTLNATRLIWPEIADNDFNRGRRDPAFEAAFPKKLIGRHSLEAWGCRLGLHKGAFGKSADWAEWSAEMQEYCEQDVRVSTALFRHILAQDYSPEALALEMAFQERIFEQERYGFPFNRARAEKLYTELSAKREVIAQELQRVFPPRVVEEVFIPKVNNKIQGYIKGVPFIKRREEEFNPRSTAHIAARLKDKYGWLPAAFTPTGEPALDEEALEALPYPEAKKLAEYRELQKIVAMLAEGKAGWLKLVKDDGRIYGRVVTNGCVSGRCSHNSPNLGQVPKQGAYGPACRELFEAGPPDAGGEWVLVGADASGLELRVFGHFLARYDGGKYAHEVVQGDIHTANQKAAGLATRDEAKTFIYAFLYGAGPVLLGALLRPDGTEEQKRKAGLALKRRFLARTPAIKKLLEDLSTTLNKRKWLRGLDGRRLHVRSKHSALNLIFQSAGACLMKLATVLWHEKMEAKGYKHGLDYVQVAHCHDEIQALARPRLAEEAGRLFVEAIEEAGRHFGFRVPMTGEYKIGKNWKETH
jgi:hypothetical protein